MELHSTPFTEALLQSTPGYPTLQCGYLNVGSCGNITRTCCLKFTWNDFGALNFDVLYFTKKLLMWEHCMSTAAAKLLWWKQSAWSHQWAPCQHWPNVSGPVTDRLNLTNKHWPWKSGTPSYLALSLPALQAAFIVMCWCTKRRREAAN